MVEPTESLDFPDEYVEIRTPRKVGHAGIGSQGPTCPVCECDTVWLSDSDDTSVYYQCGTCLRAYEFWKDGIVWWPNDEGVDPPLGGLEAIPGRQRQPKSYTIAVVVKPPERRESYTIRVKEMTDR